MAVKAPAGARRPRRLARSILIGVTALVAGSLVWATVVVLRARRRTSAIFAAALRPERSPLGLDALGSERLRTLLAVEDPGFYEHSGVDWQTPGAGLTTITQSLVKQLYFERFEPGLRAKLEQTLIARYAVDPAISKHDQLRIFVNRAYFGVVQGAPVYGLVDAAHVYFDRPLEALGPREYLALVAMLAAPKTYSVRDAPAANAERVARIERLLAGRCRPRGLLDDELAGCR